MEAFSLSVVAAPAPASHSVSHHGDFAAGLRRLGRSPRRGDYARGLRADAPLGTTPLAIGHYATGLARAPQAPRQSGDFATGQRIGEERPRPVETHEERHERLATDAGDVTNQLSGHRG